MPENTKPTPTPGPTSPTVYIDGKPAELSNQPLELPSNKPKERDYIPLLISSSTTLILVGMTAWLFYDGARKGDDGEGWLALTMALVCIPSILATCVLLVVYLFKLINKSMNHPDKSNS